ncbi:gluconeogenesis factor YvcK family protein [Candidatus Electronema sp. TJ]|uniref:gluconeogenesis factor YvcK family protein n=1 Tax=Candidatus Electronema sp. TJ TaxID=3401573 RepID=UPI003AA80C8A
MADNRISFLQEVMQGLSAKRFAPLDFLGKGSLAERALALVLGEEPPSGVPGCAREWQQLAEGLRSFDVSDTRVVVLGGGTGLSRAVGGDSRRPEWKLNPFTGLKEVFPNLCSLVCVTDDGGSTGEMLKDFPLISLGDLRRVLLASVRSSHLKNQYRLKDAEAAEIAGMLHGIFNLRFSTAPDSPEQLWKRSGAAPERLPAPLAGYLSDLIKRLFSDQRMKAALRRPQCLGNLLIAAAVYGKLPAFFRTAELIANQKRLQAATLDGIAELSVAVGAGGRNAVLPCTVTPAQLQVLYANGVMVTGEAKAGTAERGWPVERVSARFTEAPVLPDEAAAQLRRADIIILAPGSLYTSIIPILQVPGIAELIRSSKALKLLMANIWVQQGETDATLDAPERRFHVSDLIRAYNHNIPGGTEGLFSHVLTIDMADIPGSVLQNYAIEKKEPIYVDSGQVRELGFEPVQARIFSRDLLRQENIVQHDPAAAALAVRALWGLRAGGFLADPQPPTVRRKAPQAPPLNICQDKLLPCIRHEEMGRIINTFSFRQVSLAAEQTKELELPERERLAAMISEIIWRHPDIHPGHLSAVRGVCLVSPARWSRSQQWDNVFSFYNPEDGCLTLREDLAEDAARLEMPLLVAVGQSLLGNYCAEKHIEPVLFHERQVGRIYWLTVRDQHDLNGFLSAEQIDAYLQLAQMSRPDRRKRLYARTVNGEDGFLPPGLLFGLFFAWCLDNRFAPSIDHMMSMMKSSPTALVAKQAETVRRQERLTAFFREHVFRSQTP